VDNAHNDARLSVPSLPWSKATPGYHRSVFAPDSERRCPASPTYKDKGSQTGYPRNWGCTGDLGRSGVIWSKIPGLLLGHFMHPYRLETWDLDDHSSWTDKRKPWPEPSREIPPKTGEANAAAGHDMDWCGPPGPWSKDPQGILSGDPFAPGSEDRCPASWTDKPRQPRASREACSLGLCDGSGVLFGDPCPACSSDAHRQEQARRESDAVYATRLRVAAQHVGEARAPIAAADLSVLDREIIERAAAQLAASPAIEDNPAHRLHSGDDNRIELTITTHKSKARDLTNPAVRLRLGPGIYSGIDFGVGQDTGVTVTYRTGVTTVRGLTPEARAAIAGPVPIEDRTAGIRWLAQRGNAAWERLAGPEAPPPRDHTHPPDNPRWQGTASRTHIPRSSWAAHGVFSPRVHGGRWAGASKPLPCTPCGKSPKGDVRNPTLCVCDAPAPWTKLSLKGRVPFSWDGLAPVEYSWTDKQRPVPPPDGGPERLRALSGAIVAAVCGVCTPLQRELLATSTEVERRKASAHALRTLPARAGCEFEESCIRAAKAAGFDPAQLTSAGDLGLTLLCGQEVAIGVDIELARSMRERSHNIPPPKSSGIRGPGHVDAFKPGPKRSDPVLYDTSALEAHIQKTVMDAMHSPTKPIPYSDAGFPVLRDAFVRTWQGLTDDQRAWYGKVDEAAQALVSGHATPKQTALLSDGLARAADSARIAAVFTQSTPWTMDEFADARAAQLAHEQAREAARLKSAAEAQWDADVSAWGFRPESLDIGPHRPVHVLLVNPADVSIWIDGVQVSGPVLDPRYLAPAATIKLVSGHTIAGLDPEPPRE
jgi:hypothetical protein